MKPNEDQIPDLLRELKSKGDGFIRPKANYFDNITEQALKEARQPKVVKMTSNKRSYRQWLAYAASLALVLTLYDF